MRRMRRGAGHGSEFGGSGEDSFVAVVVTKLTGALLFILLLTMVIMALIPKAVDNAQADRSPTEKVEPLTITTPEALPEAIAGRPYTVALAARGGRGALAWALDGTLPKGLAFEPTTGVLRGTPAEGTPRPVELVARVSDGADREAKPVRLVVYKSDAPLAVPSAWTPKLPPVPWRSCAERGFGFLVLLCVHTIGMNTLGGVERWSAAESDAQPDARRSVRFAIYRWIVRLSTLGACVALAVWMTRAA